LEPLDILKPKEVSALLARVKPAVVYLPVANPHVDWCEEHPEEAYEINVKATLGVAKMAVDQGAKPVFYSTDYVFDGEKGPYDEEAPTRPLQVYGRHKLEVEEGLLKFSRDALILRTAVVFGREHQGKNFVYTMRRMLGSGRTMQVPMDQISSPTYAQSLAEYSVRLALQGERGVFNVVGADTLSRYEFALKAAEVFGWNPDLIQPVSSDQLHQKARRPLRAGLVMGKAPSAVNLAPLAVETALRFVKVELERSLRS